MKKADKFKEFFANFLPSPNFKGIFRAMKGKKFSFFFVLFVVFPLSLGFFALLFAAFVSSKSGRQESFPEIFALTFGIFLGLVLLYLFFGEVMQLLKGALIVYLVAWGLFGGLSYTVVWNAMLLEGLVGVRIDRKPLSKWFCDSE